MLEAKDITIRYATREVVSGISLQCAPGEFVSVLGPNGAGKSTLLRSLNGALVPASGSVVLDARPLESFSRRGIAKRIAVVAQEAEVRFPVTVTEFVLGGRYAWANAGSWGWENSEDVRIAREILNETELDGLESRLMSELSGGERQRAVLARALASEAAVYLLDEPTANLDLAHQAAILKLVKKRCVERNAAALVITHDLNLAAEFSDYVLLMKHGRKLAFGRPDDVLTPDLIREVFAVDVLVDAHPVSGAPRVTALHL